MNHRKVNEQICVECAAIEMLNISCQQNELWFFFFFCRFPVCDLQNAFLNPGSSRWQQCPEDVLSIHFPTEPGPENSNTLCSHHPRTRCVHTGCFLVLFLIILNSSYKSHGYTRFNMIISLTFQTGCC